MGENMPYRKEVGGLDREECLNLVMLVEDPIHSAPLPIIP